MGRLGAGLALGGWCLPEGRLMRSVRQQSSRRGLSERADMFGLGAACVDGDAVARFVDERKNLMFAAPTESSLPRHGECPGPESVPTHGPPCHSPTQPAGPHQNRSHWFRVGGGIRVTARFTRQRPLGGGVDVGTNVSYRPCADCLTDLRFDTEIWDSFGSQVEASVARLNREVV